MVSYRSFRLRIAVLGLLLVSILSPAWAGGGGDGKKFDVSGTLFHHVLETHNWHIVDIPKGGSEYIHVEIPLPWILYNSKEGFQFFCLDGAHAEQDALGKGYVLSHEKLYPVKKGVQVLENGYPRPEFQEHLTVTAEGKWIPKKGDHHIVADHSGNLYEVDHSVSLWDFSLSKTPLQMLIVGLIMLFLFLKMAAYYKRNPGQAPKGIASFLEPIIQFVESDIAKPNMHGKHARYMPYLLTLFFFIWFANILGLTPLNSNIAGNIAITVALATLTLLITLFSGTRDYYQHIFWFPGVPLPVKFILLPVELVGVFTKPFSLTIRLFANIAAGHFMVMALISLIFIVGKAGESVAGAVAITPLSLLFSLFIMTMEVLVAAIQAYVFTLLTCVFIGQAMETHHHDHDHDHGHDHKHAHA
ncbi:MAG: F0F1 ATP synthase subunit A [Bacteroidetes bacterium]|nr:F0F1 ATP synthase subunit A [Bacteroidota bacterium]